MERLKVAVGCPIRSRAWIFPEWVECVRAAFFVAGIEPYWVFNIGIEPEDDDDTFKLVTDLYKTDNGMWRDNVENSRYLEPGKRRWGQDDFRRMVLYRNELLELVRAAEPDYFLSLDSDILIHPLALAGMLDVIREKGDLSVPYSAVGGKAFLSDSISRPCPTFAILLGSALWDRPDIVGVAPVDALMAIKLLDPDAYNVDYEFSIHGEDIGWSVACRNAGLRFAGDGRVCSKHVMKPEQLNIVDQRVGW